MFLDVVRRLGLAFFQEEACVLDSVREMAAIAGGMPVGEAVRRRVAYWPKATMARASGRTEGKEVVPV